MNQYLSDKIKILSTAAIFLVLFIHMTFYPSEIENCTIFPYIQNLIGGIIGSCAVPLFFIISGYLFFFSVPNGLSSTFFRKIKKRAKTLLIPYLIAAMFFVLFFIAIESMPFTNKFMNSSLLTILSKQNIVQILQSIFWNGADNSPLAYHLWFLKDLLVIIIFTPLIFLCLKYLKWIYIFILLALSYFKFGMFINITSLFYFSLGGILINNHRFLSNIRGDKSFCIALFAISLIAVIVKSIEPDLIFWNMVNIPFICLILFTIWMVYNCIFQPSFLLQKYPFLTKLTSYNFFIYLFHIPPMLMIKKVIVFSMEKTELAYFLSYFLSPALIICIYVCVGQYIKGRFPRIWNVVTGGR